MDFNIISTGNKGNCVVINYNTDCFFFTNVQDMGANIPTCNYHLKLGYCPCNKCDNYVSESKAYEIVYRYLEERKNENE